MKETRVDPAFNSLAGRTIDEGMSHDRPVATRPRNGRSPRALLQSVFREERFFLILSVFIGIFSGLAVVGFRFAIGWCRIYLLGSGAVLSPTRLLLAPTLGGFVIVGLGIHVSRSTRGGGVRHNKT